MHCTIIAEIGENHIGKMDLAKQMIEAAAKAGADAVKFQSFKGDDVPATDPEKEWFYKVELSDVQHHELKKTAEDNGIEFLSAPFSVERARFLCEGLRLKTIKVASSQIVNEALLSYVNSRAKTVYLSTGIATIKEIQKALRLLSKVKRIYLLHCVSEYPVPKEHANLLVIPTLRKRFNLPVGYSDHTLGITAPIAAVALGAVVVEKHFTLDKYLPGTDHVLSADPKELRDMVTAIREVEAMLGSPEKRMTPGELKNKEGMRTRFSLAEEWKAKKRKK